MAEPQIPPQELAQQLLTAIRGMAGQVPGYVFIPATERRRLALQANVPVRFLTSAAAALDASPALVGATGVTGATIRDAVEFRNLFLPVAEELAIVTQGVRHTVTIRLSEVGTLAYQVYAIAKTINRTADREVLIPHIESMRRNLDRKRPSGTEPDEPEPATTPPTQPPATTPPTHTEPQKK